MTSIVDEPISTDATVIDRRGSWVPNGSMILTRIMELRKRRGVMIMLAAVLIGFPAIFLTIRLILHAADPKTYGPAGGYDLYTAMVAGVLYVFGFIVAATLGATAGSSDLGDGMFRHLVITGRSRLAIYLARIPAGLAILVPMVAAGFAVVCAVCVFAAPTQLNYQGVIVPVGLSESGLENWAAQHAELVVCAFPSENVRVALPCYVNNGRVTIVKKFPPGVTPPPKPTAAQLQVAARKIAAQDYVDYKQTFLYPPVNLMVKSGLWLELDAAIAFLIGLGLSSLTGQRTVTVVLMIILEVILTPIAINHVIPHFLNAQRGVIGIATARVEPGGLPTAFANNGIHGPAVKESVTVAVIVMLSWVVVWSALGAWRMMKRDA